MFSRAVSYAVTLVVVVMACSAPLAAQKSKSKSFTIGSITVTPPSGKKSGSIGSVEIKTLLKTMSADQAVGLTGRTQGTALEFAMYAPGMSTVIIAMIDGVTRKDASKQEWWITASTNTSCLLGSSIYGGEDDMEGGYRNASVFIVAQGATADLVEEVGDYYGLHVIDLACNAPRSGDSQNTTKARRGAPYIEISQSTPDMDYGTSAMIALGTGRVIQLDQTYTRLQADGCKLIGMICYSVDQESKERTPSHYGRDCSEQNVSEYFLIDPETGVSTRYR